jgi:hypothetical protein
MLEGHDTQAKPCRIARSLSKAAALIWIWGFEGSIYESTCLLGCDALWSDRSPLTYQVNILPPSSMSKILWCVELLLCNDLETGGNTGPFLGNGSINTFPQQQTRTQE